MLATFNEYLWSFLTCGAQISYKTNTVGRSVDNNSLLYIRHDCLSADGVGDGAKAWSLLQQRYSNVEKPTVVSLVRQISRLQLSENEKLSEYFIRAQELMSRLTEAGEKISETLFNALVINGLPEKYEHFIVQESFNPAENFTELRTRLQNFDDSRFKETKLKRRVQQLCILEIRQAETKAQASRREIVSCVEILDISPSNVVKEVQLTVQSARKRDIYQKHAEVQVNLINL